jgi:2-oxoisovalerate dehydrogenase E1 component alpha subunit
LIREGQWSDDAHRELSAALEQEAADAFLQAESFGTMASGLGYSDETMFQDVYETMPMHLRDQMKESSSDTTVDVAEAPILKLDERTQRAVG